MNISFSFKKIQLLIVVVFVAIIGITVFIARQRSDNRTRASEFSVMEAEGGIFTGKAAKVTDSEASGGQYILFGQTSTSQ